MSIAHDARTLADAIEQSLDVGTLAVELLGAVEGPVHWDIGASGKQLVIRPGWSPLQPWQDYLWISHRGPQ